MENLESATVQEYYGSGAQLHALYKSQLRVHECMHRSARVRGGWQLRRRRRRLGLFRVCVWDRLRGLRWLGTPLCLAALSPRGGADAPAAAAAAHLTAPAAATGPKPDTT